MNNNEKNMNHITTNDVIDNNQIMEHPTNYYNISNTPFEVIPSEIMEAIHLRIEKITLKDICECFVNLGYIQKNYKNDIPRYHYHNNVIEFSIGYDIKDLEFKGFVLCIFDINYTIHKTHHIMNFILNDDNSKSSQINSRTYHYYFMQLTKSKAEVLNHISKIIADYITLHTNIYNTHYKMLADIKEVNVKVKQYDVLLSDFFSYMSVYTKIGDASVYFISDKCYMQLLNGKLICRNIGFMDILYAEFKSKYTDDFTNYFKYKIKTMYGYEGFEIVYDNNIEFKKTLEIENVYEFKKTLTKI